ncbi:Outer Dense Fiber Protein 2 [Manis pentadactyla]|nr:Outer Dense Fiber Protein 2 [Manis pentadactyla]
MRVIFFGSVSLKDITIGSFLGSEDDAFSWFPYGKENLLEEETLLTKVMKTRLEADEVATHLERCGKENQILKDEMNKEIEAADRHYQSRLRDLKDRLEQSESTSRSMQNYIQFLKSSYANVFGDSAYTTYLTSSPIHS